MIRPLVEKYEQAFPALLEIPSKDHPYGKNGRLLAESCGLAPRQRADWVSAQLDPSKDSVLKKVKKILGN